MDNKPLLRLLVILLVLSCAVFASAVPATSKFQGFDADLYWFS